MECLSDSPGSEVSKKVVLASWLPIRVAIG
jgi:hypothetical protein